MDAATHIVILTETDSLEKRVALTPEGVQALKKEHEAIRITVETGAGEASGYADKEYVEAGAETGEDRKALAASADLLLAVNFPPDEVIRGMKKGSAVISFMWALQHADRVKMLQECNVTGVAMDTIPRISRAQSMDALSSMSNIAGYRAAIIGADTLN
ncbi:MAG: NAD(P)(+) transhydrogenase (Re/Si-specific) subunit alpha, partial [Bacteroidetes bacterium]